VTIHLNQCVVVMLTNEQVSMLCDAIRDRRASNTTADASGPGLARALPSNVRQLPERKVG
jgi:hypothetical protein